MARALIVFIGSCFLLGACTQRSICPAFQSAYIYDKDVLRKKFSYFQEDSTPKVLTASKNQYLVAEPTPYRKKLRDMQTVVMKPVLVHVPDSLTDEDSVSMEELRRAARSIIDSTFIEDRPERSQAPAEDSVYVISKDRELRLLKYNGADSLVYDPVLEKYVAQKPEYYVKDVRLNIEQDNYMWYLRDYLVLPDVRIARMQQSSEKKAREAVEKKVKKKEKKRGFFKNLFRKKQKQADSTDIPPPPTEEFDFIDADTLTQAEPHLEDEDMKRQSLAARKKKPTDEPVINDPILSANKRTGTKPAVAKKDEEEQTPAEGF